MPYTCRGQAQNKLFNEGFILKANIIQLVDQFSFPTVQFSAEKKLSPSFSISGELGYQFYEFKRAGVDTSFINKKGVKANIEIRYYDFLKIFQHDFENNEDLTGPYLAINFFYRQNKYNTNVYYTRPNDPSVYNDCF